MAKHDKKMLKTKTSNTYINSIFLRVVTSKTTTSHVID